MRDPKRIRKFCNLLAAAWEMYPDWRFGQLMANVFEYIQEEGKDPFFLEEEEMVRYIERVTGVTF